MAGQPSNLCTSSLNGAPKSMSSTANSAISTSLLGAPESYGCPPGHSSSAEDKCHHTSVPTSSRPCLSRWPPARPQSLSGKMGSKFPCLGIPQPTMRCLSLTPGKWGESSHSAGPDPGACQSAGTPPPPVIPSHTLLSFSAGSATWLHPLKAIIPVHASESRFGLHGSGLPLQASPGSSGSPFPETVSPSHKSGWKGGRATGKEE